MERQKNGWSDGQQIDKQTDRQAVKTDRQIDRQTLQKTPEERHLNGAERILPQNIPRSDDCIRYELNTVLPRNWSWNYDQNMIRIGMVDGEGNGQKGDEADWDLSKPYRKSRPTAQTTLFCLPLCSTLFGHHEVEQSHGFMVHTKFGQFSQKRGVMIGLVKGGGSQEEVFDGGAALLQKYRNNGAVSLRITAQ